MAPPFEPAAGLSGFVPTVLASDKAGNFHAAWKDPYRAKNFMQPPTFHVWDIHAGRTDRNNGPDVAVQQGAAGVRDVRRGHQDHADLAIPRDADTPQLCAPPHGAGQRRGRARRPDAGQGRAHIRAGAERVDDAGPERPAAPAAAWPTRHQGRRQCRGRGIGCRADPGPPRRSFALPRRPQAGVLQTARAPIRAELRWEADDRPRAAPSDRRAIRILRLKCGGGKAPRSARPPPARPRPPVPFGPLGPLGRRHRGYQPQIAHNRHLGLVRGQW